MSPAHVETLLGLHVEASLEQRQSGNPETSCILSADGSVSCACVIFGFLLFQKSGWLVGFFSADIIHRATAIKARSHTSGCAMFSAHDDSPDS